MGIAIVGILIFCTLICLCLVTLLDVAVAMLAEPLIHRVLWLGMSLLLSASAAAWGTRQFLRRKAPAFARSSQWMLLFSLALHALIGVFAYFVLFEQDWGASLSEYNSRFFLVVGTYGLISLAFLQTFRK